MLKCVWGEIDELQGAARPPGDRGPRLSRWTADDELLPLLSPETQRAVRALWGTETATKSIDRILSCQAPAARMLEALSPAIDLWDDLLDDAWRVASGYYRPRDSGSLDRYEPLLARLEAIGTPVERDALQAIIDSLRSVRAGTPRDAFSVGISISITDGGELATSALERRASEGEQVFTAIRDIVTTARRRWAESFLDRFLDERWRAPLTAAATDYGRRLVERDGKPPTIKQSAPIDLINLWFAGEVEPYYRLIGHPRDHMQLRNVVVVNPDEVVKSTMEVLGVRNIRSSDNRKGAVRWHELEEHERHLYSIPHDIKRRVLDIWRALELADDPAVTGPPPHVDHVMRDVAAALHTSPDDAWRRLTAVVLAQLPEPSDAGVMGQ